MRCLNCTRTFDTHSNLDDRDLGVKAGDLTICLYCGCPHVFKDDLTLRFFSVDDLPQLTMGTLQEFTKAMIVSIQYQGRRDVRKN